MDIFVIFTILIGLAAVFGFINIKFLKMPSTIGMMLISIVFTIGLVIAGKIHAPIAEAGAEFMKSIDFEKVLLDIMLSFLLFAGALHTDLEKLKKQKWPILIISTFGVITSTFLIGGIFYYVAGFFGFDIKFIYCLIFGALISPTDPIAVLGILKEAKAPKQLEIKIVGESLFNDGIGVVVFLSLYHIAESSDGAVHFADISMLFVQEVFGGLAIGAITGGLAYLMLKAIDHYETEVIITIALVSVSYVIAQSLHFSGPLAVVLAGLFIGNRARSRAFSVETEKYIDQFWEIADVILNAILFVLIGLEIMILPFDWKYWLLGAALTPLVLIIRFSVLSPPVMAFRKRLNFAPKTALIMTWGGLRGGISIALALSLSDGTSKDIILTVTYFIVAFSIIFQGLSLKSLIQKTQKENKSLEK